MRHIKVGGTYVWSFIVIILASITSCTSSAEVPLSSQPVVTTKSTIVPVSPTTPASTTASTMPVSISWSQAAGYIGKTVTICGPVVGTHWAKTSKGKPTFINIGRPYPDPDRFTVIIWDSNRASFSQPPEKYYDTKTICVTGLLTQYNGMPQVEVKSPDQIVVR